MARKKNPRGVYVRALKWTPQERQQLRLYSQGLTDEECARLFGIRTDTVTKRKRRLFTKLGAYSKAELVKHAKWKGLV